MVGEGDGFIESVAPKRDNRNVGIGELEAANDGPALLKRGRVVEKNQINAKARKIELVRIFASKDGEDLVAGGLHQAALHADHNGIIGNLQDFYLRFAHANSTAGEQHATAAGEISRTSTCATPGRAEMCKRFNF